MRSFHFPGRSPVYGRRAMCATSHPAASLAAIETLKAGGNAVDAAIATAAVLAVVECPMTGIGGDCFAIRRQARREADRPQRRGSRAQGGHRGLVRQAGHQAHRDHQRACRHRARRHRRLVPAARGSRQPCRCERLLAPAIELAEGGFVVAPRVAADWANGVRKFTGAGAKKHLLKDGRAPQAGEVMRFPALAATLKAHRQGRPRRLLRGRGGQGHGGRARRRSAACTRSTTSPRRRAAPATSSRSRSPIAALDLVRAAAQQPGHRRADHAEDAGPARQAQRRSGLRRALPRADGGGAARLCHARYLRRRSRHGRRARRAHARRRA